jgi:uncharacterized protein
MSLIGVTLIILFLAALTKATLGFGESLLAIPLLTLSLGLQVAAPLVSLVAATVTLFIILRSWQQMDLRATWRLLIGAVPGVFIGAWALKSLPEAWATTLLGVLLILVGAYHLVKPTLRALPGDGWAYGFGLLAGLFGGAYNMASPPVLIYGAVRRWPPEQFRVTLQGFFLPVSALILISHASAGLWTAQVIQLYLLSLPVLLLAFGIGSRLSRRLPTALFARLIYGALIVLGIALLLPR